METQNFLESFAEAMDAQCMGKAKRSDEPSNTYMSNAETLLQGFPWIFMFGKKVPNLGVSLSTVYSNHVLKQFTNIAAEDVQFQGFLYSEMRKRSNNQGVNYKLKGDLKSFQKLKDLVSDREEFERELKEAIKNPSSTEAKKLVQTICSISTSAQSNVPFGHFERQNSITDIMALTAAHGPPSAYITITQNDLDEPNSLRLTFWSIDNKSFPCMSTQEFEKSLGDSSDFILDKFSSKVGEKNENEQED